MLLYVLKATANFFHFCLETPIFFSQPENHVSVTFLYLKKNRSLARPIFAENQFFEKKLLLLRGEQNFFLEKKFVRLLHFFLLRICHP